MWRCEVCPFTTSDPTAREGHESYSPTRGWLGYGEAHVMRLVTDTTAEERAKGVPAEWWPALTVEVRAEANAKARRHASAWRTAFGLLNVRPAVDDPTDEPTDEPAWVARGGSCPDCGHRWAGHRATVTTTVGCVAERDMEICDCRSLIPEPAWDAMHPAFP